MIVVDATDQILGRMASMIAKMLLEGEEVSVVNAEGAVITGNPTRIYEKYKGRFDLSRAVNPRRGPFYPRMPDRIVSRAIRGMLPWSKAKGKEAYRKLRVYRGVPQSLEEGDFKAFDAAKVDRIGRGRYVRVGDLAVQLGAPKEASA